MSQSILSAVSSSVKDSAFSPKERRAYAVAAALEMIATRVACATTATALENEMNRLSQYADLIEQACVVK